MTRYPDPFLALGLVCLAGLTVFALLPLYWMLVVSFRIDDAILAWPPQIIPPMEALGLSAWQAVLDDPRVQAWLANSALITAGSVTLALLAAIPAGYALARARAPEATFAGAAILASKLIPATVIVMPVYVLARMSGLLNNPLAVILGNLSFAVPLATFLIKNAFDALPRDLEEAARMDGLGRTGALIRVLLPNIAPALAATAIYVFIVSWNDFLFARTLLTGGAATTITVGAASYLGEITVEWNRLMALSVLASLPSLAFFILLAGTLTREIGAGVR